jgi:hypothetical protein
LKACRRSEDAGALGGSFVIKRDNAAEGDVYHVMAAKELLRLG